MASFTPGTPEWLDQVVEDVVDLVRAVPETVIVLDHFGCPLGVGGGLHGGRKARPFLRNGGAGLPAMI